MAWEVVTEVIQKNKESVEDFAFVTDLVQEWPMDCWLWGGGAEREMSKEWVD